MNVPATYPVVCDVLQLCLSVTRTVSKAAIAARLMGLWRTIQRRI